MHPISLISKFLIGYKIKKKLVKGIPMEYRYSGKPVFFDPIAMIQEATYKIKSSRFVFNENLESIKQGEQFDHGELEPSVSVSWMQDNNEMKAFRFVKADSNRASSLYEFYSNDSLFATFLRIYDFGKAFENFKSSLKNQIPNDSEMTKGIKIQVNPDTIFYAENFGHSQFWKLKICPELLGLD